MVKFFGFSSLDGNFSNNIEDITHEYENKYPLKKAFEYKDDKIQINNWKLNIDTDLYLQDNEIKVVFTGYCYNFVELNKIFNVKFDIIEELILFAYKNNFLKAILKEIDGYFSLCIYDKKNSKIILANDRFGLKPLYIYNKDENLAFSNELKNILFLNFTDKEINPRAFGCFKKFQAFIGEITWFKHIELLKPSTYFEFDLETRRSEAKHYWTFATIKRSNLNFNDAVDRAYEIFCETIKNYCKEDCLYTIPISGGLDSRLCLATYAKMFNKKPYVFTFGVENCRDFVNAQKVCKVGNIEHHKLYFENFDWFEYRKKIVYELDCSFSMMHMHGLEFDICKNQKQLSINGFAGDAIYGDTYLPKDKKYFNKKFDKEIAIQYYGEYFDLCGYDSEYYDIKNPLFCRLLNRVRRFTSSPFVISENKAHTLKPFFSNKVIEFVASLPNEYFDNYKLYKHMALKYFPEYFNYIDNNSNPPLYLKKDYKYRLNKLNRKISKFLQKNKILPKIIDKYILYDEWVKEPNLKNKLIKTLEKENSFYKNFDNANYAEMFKNGDLSTKDALCIASCELYFKSLKDKIDLNY